MDFPQKYTSPPSKDRGLSLKPSKIHQQPLHNEGVIVKKSIVLEATPPSIIP